MIIGDLLRHVRGALAEYGVENARFEAEQILIKAGIPKQTVMWEPRGGADPECEKRAEELLKRRLEGYPLQYLIGEWSFYACDLKVGEGVLIPRQDTETLAELADGFLKKRPQSERRVLDLCAGSGCIGIALSKFCGALTTSVEKSETAMKYLYENVELNGVSDKITAVCGDIFSEDVLARVGGEYDVIVSNPPYLTGSDMDNLQREVSFEPSEALYGGEDGLDFYRRIPEVYLEKLKSGGLFAVEIGIGQDAAVAEIFKKYGLSPRFKEDLCGVKRVVYGLK
ncbi:MAG: peptide chain release factor N(5)-glutamine methyltransferase [Oscillospiraceae bacterium]|nr:peptide chain release factor N(5)-glutamine methyltransferase [Oscillospiraceae bacterium]